MGHGVLFAMPTRWGKAEKGKNQEQLMLPENFFLTPYKQKSTV
jgi:hypothetical protein